MQGKLVIVYRIFYFCIRPCVTRINLEICGGAK